MEESDEDDIPESRESRGSQSTNRSDTTNTPATDPYTGQSSSSATPRDSIQTGMGGFADLGSLVEYGLGHNSGSTRQTFFQGQPSAGSSSVVQLYSHNPQNQRYYQSSNMGTGVSYSNFQGQLQNDRWNSFPLPNQQPQMYPNTGPSQASQSSNQPRIFANGNQLNTEISRPPGTLTGAMLNPPAISTSIPPRIRDAHSAVLAEDFEGPTLQNLVRFEIKHSEHWIGWNLSQFYNENNEKVGWVCTWPFCRCNTPFTLRSTVVRHIREEHLKWCRAMTDAEIREKSGEIGRRSLRRLARLVHGFEVENGDVRGVIAALKRGGPADKVVTMYESNEVLENDNADNDEAEDDKEVD